MFPGIIGPNFPQMFEYISSTSPGSQGNHTPRSSAVEIGASPSSGSYNILDSSDKEVATDVILKLYKYLSTTFRSPKDQELIKAIHAKVITPAICEDALNLINIFESHIRVVPWNVQSPTDCWTQEVLESSDEDSDVFVNVDLNSNEISIKGKQGKLVFHVSRLSLEAIGRYGEEIKNREYEDYSDHYFAERGKPKMTREEWNYWDKQVQPRIDMIKLFPGMQPFQKVPRKLQSRPPLKPRPQLGLEKQPLVNKGQDNAEKDKDCWEACVLF